MKSTCWCSEIRIRTKGTKAAKITEEHMKEDLLWGSCLRGIVMTRDTLVGRRTP
jgi:hypothetical protein